MSLKVIIDTNLIGTLERDKQLQNLFFSKNQLIIPHVVYLELLELNNSRCIPIFEMFKKYKNNIYFLQENQRMLKTNIFHENIKIKNYIKDFSFIYKIDISQYIVNLKKELEYQNFMKELKSLNNQHENFYDVHNLKIKMETIQKRKITEYDIKETLANEELKLEKFKIFKLPEDSILKNININLIAKNKSSFLFWHWQCSAFYLTLLSNSMNDREKEKMQLTSFRKKKNFIKDLNIISNLCFADVFISDDNDCRNCASYLMNFLKPNNYHKQSKTSNKKILKTISNLI